MVAKSNGRKILIVEDNVRLAESMAVLLKEAGYETCLAETSTQGLSKGRNREAELYTHRFGASRHDRDRGDYYP